MDGMKKFKYFTIFLLPLTVSVSFIFDGLLDYLSLIVFFGIIPLLEHLLPQDNTNLSEIEKNEASEDPFYNWLLYSLVPVQIGFLVWYLLSLSSIQNNSDLIGRTLSMGIMCGVIGINVGHELGHRLNRIEQLLGEILLTTSLENHFLPYHNRGHHHNVATPEDPATARKNEPVYLFWIRSHFGSYFQAWQIELQRMRIVGKKPLSIANRMVLYTFVNLALCSAIYFFLGTKELAFFLIVSAIGILLLETVNYIEHYGLLRKKRENGTYDRVRRIHSWNSNHILGRVVLFELSRHSDHHYKADRPYHLLETHDESPLMPTGYPGMMLLSLLPPLFFKVMNTRISSE
jgi:alkane 1-monooxygenase